MARRSSSSGRTIALPWERRGAWIRGIFSGRRWKVLLVLVLASGAMYFVARSAQLRQQEEETRAGISEIKRAISSFRNDVGRCPHSLDELMHPPRTGVRYLRRIPTDGWGHPFWVNCPGRDEPDQADVFSGGPSGSFLIDDNLQ